MTKVGVAQRLNENLRDELMLELRAWFAQRNIGMVDSMTIMTNLISEGLLQFEKDGEDEFVERMRDTMVHAITYAHKLIVSVTDQ